MESQGQKRVSPVKPDTEILGYPYAFSCHGSSSATIEKDIKEAITRCRIDPMSIFQTSVLAGFPGASENFVSVRGRRQEDLKELREALLSGDFGYRQA
jgi:hypothetical protein